MKEEVSYAEMSQILGGMSASNLDHISLDINNKKVDCRFW